MKGKSLFVISCLLFISNIALSQNTFDIIFNAKDRDQKCKECIQAFRQKPKEVRYSIIRENNDLYFEINNKNWFLLVFKNPDDGIAIDVVLKDRYACENESLSKNQILGSLLKPVYSEELKSGLISTEQNVFRVKVGEIPKEIIKNDLEYNILFLGKKNLCQYYVTYDLDYYSWGLLDMGLYLDFLTYDTKQIRSSANESTTIENKALKFIIPFEKNKADYSQAYIKPIFDTLKLTDYDIKSLNIKAYSSIEGASSRNAELQEQRANNIVSALQKIQQPTIERVVSSSENWVEFFNDIGGTKYEYLKSLSKNEVRKLMIGNMAKEMENILKNHRKAVVELELEKKLKHKSESTSLLLADFNTSISEEKLERAKEIQNSIFDKIKAQETSVESLQEMVIPKQAKYAQLINKNLVYKYVLDERLALVVYNELLELEKLVPNDAKVKYNIVALQIKLLRYKAIGIDESNLIRDINALRKYGINKSLITRMMVNFHIVVADKFMKNSDFNNKEKSVDFVNSNYKKFPLSNYDYLSLAQFFSFYGNYNLAVELLERKARSIDIDENLLFYYLNLTLIDKELTKDSNYRTILLNAYNMNKERFCKLFNSTDKGGVTFQLLENPYLRNTYCENCDN
ncbi:hypothetical protein APS56_12105 [Pseudalgibacter alginicilyticus]|uniref:OmpA-like domain-containing protein n=1 Tax=Pseudalgibacter alginicilyticus TaxID=1736674 RepID=A0A0P0CYZ2_9FLAO|nr:hypothetical protein [Pseudalgibacter alginicilyticus]ALJ05825.1 hypothetical protein APS56_12105 [Pseudalgibacter alginicilyticus]